jgi:hypothetical protein
VLSVKDLCSLSDAQLANCDPVLLNLVVVRELPELAGLDVGRYQRMADNWVRAFARWLPTVETEFRKTPWDWKNDVRYFQLGMLCQFVDETLGVRYREDHKAIQLGQFPSGSFGMKPWEYELRPPRLEYSDPDTLFLHSLMDTRRGTCGNMACLLVALAWRLRWPLSLACAWSHNFARCEAGDVTYNIEATDTGRGGFSTPADDVYIRKHGIRPEHIRSGSDLRALTPRQMLGQFIGFRARCYRDRRDPEKARRDYLVALQLFPQSRFLAAKYEEIEGGVYSRY